MKRIISIMIILIMIFSSVVYAGGGFAGASGWAIEHLEKAVDNGIITSSDYSTLYGGYSNKITRAQFAELIMRVYYKMMGEYPEPASADTFSDTNSTSVCMANAVGIINGRGNGIFAPNDYITRQEMAIMMSRSLDSMAVNYFKGDGVLTIADKDQVDSWAVAGVDFAYENGFIKGDGVNYKPKENIPIEQAVIIVNRVYEKYNGMANKNEIKNDYTKGYRVGRNDKESITVTYSNGNTETLLLVGKGNTLTKVKDIQKSPDESRIYFVSSDRADDTSIERLYYYDMNSGKVVKKPFSYKGKYQEYYTLNLKMYNIISSGDVAIETMESYHLLFNKDGEFKSFIKSAKNDTPVLIDEIKYFEAEYGEQSCDRGTQLFTYYGGKNKKVMRFVDNLGIKYNATVDGLETGSHPMILANEPYGALATVPRESQFSVNMKINKLHHDHGNAGVVFGVSSAKPGVNQTKGFLITVFPKQKKIEVGSMNYDWKRLAEYSVPNNVDLNNEFRIGGKVVPFKNKSGDDYYYLTLYIDNNKVVELLPLCYAKDMPTNGYFGVKSWAADAEYKSFAIAGMH